MPSHGKPTSSSCRNSAGKQPKRLPAANMKLNGSRNVMYNPDCAPKRRSKSRSMANEVRNRRDGTHPGRHRSAWAKVEALTPLSERPSMSHGSRFNDVVLRELYESIFSTPEKLEALPISFESMAFARSAFRKLIITESTELIHEYLSEFKEDRRNICFFSRLEKYFGQDIEGADTFRFVIEDSKMVLNSRIFQPSTLFVLQNLADSDWIAVGLVSSRSKNTVATKEFFLNMKLSLAQLSSMKNKNQSRFAVYVGPSLVTFERMYATRIKDRDLQIESMILKGTRTTLGQNQLSDVHKACTRCKSLDTTSLNKAQQRAVCCALDAQLPSVHVWQGPPGSGKTRCCIELLLHLMRSHKRTLVTGSSNQSINVILQRYLSVPDHPDTKIALVAVEEMVSDIFDYCNTTKVLSFFQKSLRRGISEGKADEGIAALKIMRERMPKTWSSLAFETPYIQLYGFRTYGRATTAGFSEDEDDEWESSSVSSSESCSSVSSGSSRSEKAAAVRNFGQSLLCRFLTQLDGLMRDQAKVQEAELEFVETASLVICTCAVAGRKVMRQAFAAQPVQYLVVDEACQSVEAETWIALSSNPRHLILVGDHKQLSATVKSQIAAKAGFSRPLMERLIMLDTPYIMLDVQYRMHPEISFFPSQMYYHSKLRDDPSVCSRNALTKRIPPCVFYDTKLCNDKFSIGSYYNQREAEIVAKIVGLLQDENIDVSKDVIVVTYYSRQVEQIIKEFKSKGLRATPRVSTVDSFQGSEATITILSFVRSNSLGRVGFITDPRRLNVSITRAKQNLIMVGDVQTLFSSPSEDLRQLVANMQARNLLVDANML